MFTRAFCSTLLISIAFVATAQFEQGPNLPRKALLGAQLSPLTPEKAKALNLPAGSIEIGRITPGATGEAIKLQTGDIVISINGKKTASAQDLTGQMRLIYGGQPITVRVLRAGKTIDLSGTTVERPKQKGDGIVVEYTQVMSQGKRIRVIATHPVGPGPFPTIFVIGGIGQYTMDGEYNAVPYGNILVNFARDYAIIRTDKPGQGDSDGPIYSDLLFDVELDAYVQSMRLTKSLPYVDKSKIAIFGHSMGGVFGPLVAQTEKVAGVAVSATISKSFIEYMLENTRRQSLLAGAKADVVDREMTDLAAVAQHLFYEDMMPKDIKRKYPAMAQAVDAQTPDGKTYSGVGLPFWQQLAKKNLPSAWLKIDAKVLALWGASDFISTRYDHEFIADIMNQKTPGSAECIILPNSDHGFLNTASMKESMEKWGRGGAAFNPNIIQTLKDWFKKTIG